LTCSGTLSVCIGCTRWVVLANSGGAFITCTLKRCSAARGGIPPSTTFTRKSCVVISASAGTVQVTVPQLLTLASSGPETSSNFRPLAAPSASLASNWYRYGLARGAGGGEPPVNCGGSLVEKMCRPLITSWYLTNSP